MPTAASCARAAVEAARIDQPLPVNLRPRLGRAVHVRPERFSKNSRATHRSGGTYSGQWLPPSTFCWSRVALRLGLALLEATAYYVAYATALLPLRTCCSTRPASRPLSRRRRHVTGSRTSRSIDRSRGRCPAGCSCCSRKEPEKSSSRQGWSRAMCGLRRGKSTSSHPARRSTSIWMTWHFPQRCRPHPQATTRRRSPWMSLLLCL